MLNLIEKRRLALMNKCIHFGKYEYAQLIINRLLKDDSENAELLRHISIFYLRMNNNKAALKMIQKSFDLEKSVETLESLANINYDCSNYADSAIQFEELLKFEPTKENYIKCIEAYKQLDYYEEVIRMCKKAIEDTDDIECYSSLFFSYVIYGMEKEAIEFIEVMKSKFPNSSVLYGSLGFLYEAIYNDYPKAKIYFEKAGKLGFIESYYNLAVCCKQSEDFKNAEKYLKKLISIGDKVKIDYNYTLGSIYMAQRKLRLGYKYYLKRKSASDINQKNKNNVWDGKDYPDKILYVSSEQGYGDNIQFVRFIPEVAKKFKKVYYSTNGILVDLFRRSFAKYDNIEIVPNGSIFRYHKFALIMDLQYYLHKNFHDIISPNSYLICDKEKQEKYKEKYFNTDKLKIGLNWRAKGMGLRDAVYRTIDAPYYFKKILDIPNIEYYSFQMGDIFNMCEKYPQIKDLTPEIKTFDDTASMLKNIDILITVDTALAHLAGSLGIKTYLLLCHAPDWRWFENDKKTEWYPSVTIIKQHDRRTWEDVSEKLYEYIKNEV